MYSTCLFCNKPLGANEVLEEFPVGRRIAFDSATGRLWVVCRACERWNLSPLEERWEVIEECEHLFSMERKRVSTDNIGLAKLNEGLELVRIGKPQRPEFAAWRYGDQFGRRRKKNMMIAGAGMAAVAGLYVAGWAAGGAFVMMGNGGGLINRILTGSPNKLIVRAEMKQPGLKFGRTEEIKRKHLDKIILAPDPEEGYVLRYPIKKDIYEIRGDEARRVMGQVLPAINRYGGQQKHVQSAVDMIERAGDPHEFVKIAAKTHAPGRYADKNDAMKHKLPREVRLALEMAAHEDAERRALEGELKDLEIAWREAEEIAAISDSLFTSNFIATALDKLKGKS